MTFQTDLTFGKEAENQVLLMIQKKYPKAHSVEGECKAYDIFVPEILSGIEVKSDRQAQITGNAFIEVKCNNSSSGICATKAKIWVYCTEEKKYWLNTSDIVNMILSNETRIFHNQPAGETSTVLGHLISLEKMEEYAMKVTP